VSSKGGAAKQSAGSHVVPWLIVLAWFAVLGSAWAAVWARHAAREQFRVVRALEQERDELDIRWRQLSLELGTLSMHARVEQLARGRLAMRAPAADEMLTVVEDDD
jgi:cell division protein FtsL